jgi:dTDP-glucose pyrophosphorylase/predicted transcriptional regulator
MTIYNWKKIILKKNDTLARAIEVLNSESLRIVLVSDNSGRLLGTITDGDIRRSLMQKADMETKLHQVMFAEPTTANINDDSNKILQLMKEKDFTAIPVLDSESKIVDLVTMKNLIEDSKLENTVFLMAGGFGKRLGELTNDTPKPLLNIGDKPIILTIIEQLIKHGFKKFIISSHYKSKMLIDYFGNGESLGIDIKHIYEDTPLGTAGSLGLIQDLNIKKPLVVMNSDLLTALNFKNLLRFHERSNVQATICAQEYVHQIPYGKLIVEDAKLKSIKEKPKEKSFINAGIYVIEPTVLQSIKKNKRLDMPDLLTSIIKKNGEVAVFPIHEYWLDIGGIEDFQKGQKEYYGNFKS